MAKKKAAKSTKLVTVKTKAAKATVKKTKAAKPKATKAAKAKPLSATGQLIPPADGAAVRMYRTGHGDCFLLAFAGDDAAKPVYVLIDCGYKPGSPAKIEPPTNIKDITESIRISTGGHIDVAVITHEHQDHVNGITEKNFEGITIGETWFAWTEDPEDDLANSLRKLFKDKLLGDTMKHELNSLRVDIEFAIVKVEVKHLEKQKAADAEKARLEKIESEKNQREQDAKEVIDEFGTRGTPDSSERAI